MGGRALSENLHKQLRVLLAKPKTIATIATLDEHGAPHSVPTPFLKLDEEGRLIHPELLETSTTHRNLLRSIWFNHPVTVTLIGGEGEVLIVFGKPVKAYVSGSIFTACYRNVRTCLGDADLAAVWQIEPIKIRDETYLTCKAREEALHPFYMHLDRLVIQP
jgi:hypothetical protein